MEDWHYDSQLKYGEADLLLAPATEIKTFNMDPKPGATLVITTPVYASANGEYYYSNTKISENYFDKCFVVTNSTYKYGKAFFSNTGMYMATVSIYDQNGVRVGYNAVGPNNNASVLFDARAESYQIKIQNDGKEKIQGILSIKTDMQEIK